MSWFRFRSVYEGRPRVRCPVCGHANIRHSDTTLNACAGCFRDSSSGELQIFQVITAVVFLAAAFLFTGMLGALAAVVLVQFPLEVFAGLKLPLAAGAIAGFLGGLWLVESLRSRELVIPAGQPVPAGVRPEKRIDKQVALGTMAAVLAFVIAWGMS